MSKKTFWFLPYLPPPFPIGPQKSCIKRIFCWKYSFFVDEKVVLWPWCQNMIFSIVKMTLACKILVLYLQNQAIHVNFSFVEVMKNLNFAKFWNPQILLKFRDIWLICIDIQLINANTSQSDVTTMDVKDVSVVTMDACDARAIYGGYHVPRQTNR